MKHHKHEMCMAILAVAILFVFLFSGCSPVGNSVAPGFLEVGGFYEVETADDEYYELVVQEIRNDGWIVVAEIYHEDGWWVPEEGRFWLNTSKIVSINKIEMELR